jgi:alpha-D-ribose 1-methylphosphonate 5-triphosphate synthase subunit PhnH
MEIIEEIKEYIRINTNCMHTDLENADFILCLDKTLNGKFSMLKKGTLYHPNESATIFYLVERIEYDFFPTSTKLSISGPGVDGELDLFLSDINHDEIKEWVRSKNEYPLGVDIYVVSRSGKIIGLPRSVGIKSGEGFKWAMSA